MKRSLVTLFSLFYPVFHNSQTVSIVNPDHIQYNTQKYLSFRHFHSDHILLTKIIFNNGKGNNVIIFLWSCSCECVCTHRSCRKYKDSFTPVISTWNKVLSMTDTTSLLAYFGSLFLYLHSWCLHVWKDFYFQTFNLKIIHRDKQVSIPFFPSFCVSIVFITVSHRIPCYASPHDT